MYNVCLNVSLPEEYAMIAYDVTKEMEERNYINSTILKIDDYEYDCRLISYREYLNLENKVDAFNNELYDDLYYFKAAIQFEEIFGVEDPTADTEDETVDDGTEDNMGEETFIEDMENMDKLETQLNKLEKLMSCEHNFVSYTDIDLAKITYDFIVWKGEQKGTRKQTSLPYWELQDSPISNENKNEGDKTNEK